MPVASADVSRSVTNHALQQLMLGLIYPAVLGSVMYSAVGPITVAVRAAMTRGSQAPLDWVLIVKLLLLLATIAFYSFDYMYILFTRHYRPSYFWFDVAFTATLYLTVGAIALDESSDTPPNGLTIAVCYLVFLVLYLLWDWPARRAEDNREGESGLYNLVVVWELVGIALLAVAIVVNLVSAGKVGLIATTTSVLIVTIPFFFLAWAKRLYASFAPASISSPPA